MKLVKGSLQAKRYMASIRAKKKINGDELNEFSEFQKRKYNITFEDIFSKAKAVRGTELTPKQYNDAVKQMQNKEIVIDRFNSKQGIREQFIIKKIELMKKLGSVKASTELKKTLKAKKLYMPHGYATAKRKRKINGVHKDTKSHNVRINVLSGYSGLSKKDVAIDLKRLKQIASSSNNKLTKKVASILIKGAKGYNEGVQTYMAEVIKYGCQSGFVPELIYYNQTTKFYKTYKKEIFAMLKNTLLEYGYLHPHELFGNKWDNEDYNFTHTTNQNLLAWYSFEETTRELANLLGYEL